MVDDLGYVVEGFVGAIPVARRIELADVPGGEQQGASDVALGYFPFESFPEPQ
jgi:hypothetical protein